MPEFEVMPLQEAMISSTTTGKGSPIAQQYASYIQRVRLAEAGKLTPSDGDTVATVRHCLGAAVKVSAGSMHIKRIGANIYFWDDAPKRRVGGHAGIPFPDPRARRLCIYTDASTNERGRTVCAFVLATQYRQGSPCLRKVITLRRESNIPGQTHQFRREHIGFLHAPRRI